MRHAKKIKKIGRTHAHRKATMAALSTSLIEHKRITTTLPKAKALRSFVEPLINRAKEDTTHNRRQVFRRLQSKEAVKTLFGEVAEALGDRPGGYTRIVKLGQRGGDSAEMAVIELVDFNDVKPEGGSSGKKKTRRSRRKSSSPTPAAATAATEEVVDPVAESDEAEDETAADDSEDESTAEVAVDSADDAVEEVVAEEVEEPAESAGDDTGEAEQPDAEVATEAEEEVVQPTADTSEEEPTAESDEEDEEKAE